MKKFMNKFLLILFCCLILINNISISTINADVTSATSAIPDLNAQGVYLMDGFTGKVLFEKNSNFKFEPASTTKVMTAILTLENTKLTDEVIIGPNPPTTDGSAVGLVEGEIYTIEELLYALLLPSANDAAVALAEHISGSTEEFARLMTKKAHELGATDTTFKNPSGLHDDGHLTTAHDLALILQYAIQFDDYVRISRTSEYKYENKPYPDGSEKWAINQNNCLPVTYSLINHPDFVYDNLYCGKTGYTPEANHTYVAAAKKDDQFLIGAFLNADDKTVHYSSVGKLFNWGFTNYKTEKIISAGDELAEYPLSAKLTIPLIATKDIYYTFLSSDTDNLDLSIEYPVKDYSAITIRKGDILFNDASLLINGEKYDTIELASGLTHKYSTKVKLKETISSLVSNKYFIPFTLGLIIIIIFLSIKLIKKIRFMKRRRNIRRKHNF